MFIFDEVKNLYLRSKLKSLYKQSSRSLGEAKAKTMFILVVRLKSLIYKVNQWIAKQPNRSFCKRKRC